MTKEKIIVAVEKAEKKYASPVSVEQVKEFCPDCTADALQELWLSGNLKHSTSYHTDLYGVAFGGMDGVRIERRAKRAEIISFVAVALAVIAILLGLLIK